MKAYTAIQYIDRGSNANPSAVKPGEVFAFTGSELQRLLDNQAVRESTPDEIALAKAKNGGRLGTSQAFDVSELDVVQDEVVVSNAEKAAAEKIAEAEKAAAEKLAEADRLIAEKIAEAEKVAAEKIAAAEKAAAEKAAEADKASAAPKVADEKTGAEAGNQTAKSKKGKGDDLDV